MAPPAPKRAHKDESVEEHLSELSDIEDDEELTVQRMAKRQKKLERAVKNNTKKCAENEQRIEHNEQNSRALNIIVVGYPRYTNGQENDVGTFFSKLCFEGLKVNQPKEKEGQPKPKPTNNVERLINDVSKIHWLPPKDNVTPFIVKFLRQWAKDLIFKSVTNLKGYEPFGRPISIRHDLTAKQRKAEKRCKTTQQTLSGKGVEARVVVNAKEGYHLMINNQRYQVDSDYVKSLLARKNKETKNDKGKTA
jgi:hypothetical protein